MVPQMLAALDQGYSLPLEEAMTSMTFVPPILGEVTPKILINCKGT